MMHGLSSYVVQHGGSFRRQYVSSLSSQASPTDKSHAAQSSSQLAWLMSQLGLSTLSPLSAQ